MSPAFQPTHAAPEGGLPAWQQPVPSTPVVATIEPRVEMQVIGVQGDWTHIVCSNGWSAWVDGRRLVPLGAPAAAAAPSAPAAPAPSVARPAAGATKGGLANLWPRNQAGLVGAALVLVGMFLPWEGFRHSSVNAIHIPLFFLFQFDTATSSPNLELLLLAAAVALAVPGRRNLQKAAGWTLIGACALYLLQLQRLLSKFPGAPSIASAAGLGVLVTAAGGAVALFWRPKSG